MIDTLPPVLSTPPADTTVNCDQVPPAPVLGVELTATDNCDTAVSIVLAQDTIDRVCTNGYTIRRTWVAMDNCNNTDTTQQLITVIDTVAPVLTCRAPANVLLFDKNRCDSLIVVSTTVTENCSDLTGIEYYFEVDFDSNGSVDTSGTVRSPSIRYPVSFNPHTFRLKVTDDCGNMDSCSLQINIIDRIGPSFECSPAVVYLDSMGMGFVRPNSFVTDLFDCKLDTLFYTDLPNDTIPVTCDSLFDLNNPRFISVTAVDSFNNPTECTAELIVLDTFGVCSNFALTTVSGQVTTDQQDPLPDIQLYLNGRYQQLATTRSDGSFEFPYVPVNSSFEVQPEKNINHRNGVSTFDLVLISKHITGQQPLDFPYKQIAADINNSGNISTFDIIELREVDPLHRYGFCSQYFLAICQE